MSNKRPVEKIEIDWEELEKEGRQYGKVEQTKPKTLSGREHKLLAIIVANEGINFTNIEVTYGSSSISIALLKLQRLNLIKKKPVGNEVHYYSNKKK